MKPRSGTANQGDLLLWVAGGGIAAVGSAWLLLTSPWAGPDEATVRPPAAAIAPAPAATAPPTASSRAPDSATPLDNPLRMAQLAYDAGMLVEPEEYSAWTLYARVLRAEPSNATAVAGLTQVADDLVRRGETALDQGRFDFARSTVERIRSELPEHAGARTLAAKIWPEATSTPAAVEPPRTPALPIARVEVEPPSPAPAAAPPAAPRVDVVAQHAAAFDAAMAAGRLLTPPTDSAKHFLAALAAADSEHESTRLARERLSREFLSRAAQAIEALDGEAAAIWIDEAQAIGIDPDGVRRTRAALTDHLVALESAKPTPASSLKLVNYVAPDYPDRALDRRLDGWVDVEFTVNTDGSTGDVTIVDASHDTMFRREALEAVAKWRFEPRVYMGRLIPQRSYTRIRFVD